MAEPTAQPPWLNIPPTCDLIQPQNLAHRVNVWLEQCTSWKGGVKIMCRIDGRDSFKIGTILGQDELDEFMRLFFNRMTSQDFDALVANAAAARKYLTVISDPDEIARRQETRETIETLAILAAAIL